MRFRCHFFILLSVSVVFTSCTIEKRHYRNGFYVNWNHATAGEEPERTEADTLHPLLKSTETDIEVPFNSENADSATGGTLMQKPEGKRTLSSEDTGSASELEYVHVTDEPKPEGHDRMNPTVASLTIGGMVFSLIFLLIDVFAIAGSAPFFMVIAPWIGVAMFALALYLRHRYQLRIAGGEKSEALRMSAHYHRFRVLLYLFFAASLMMSIGWAFALGSGFLTSGLGIVGVILGGGGMVLVQGVGAVLLILGVLYLILWRKDPTGFKPPRDPHPPKDR